MKKLAIVAVVLLGFGASAAGGAVAGKRFLASPGDIILTRGTKTICAVVKHGKNPPYITCYAAAANGGPRVNSYGIAITDKRVYIARYVTQRKTKTIYQRRHGS